LAIFVTTGQELCRESELTTLTATDAEYGFDPVIGLARAEPVVVAKHGRPVIVVMAKEERVKKARE
jgi:prevent-host-death family protein